ncbi:RNA polymerase sigma factor [Chitinophaga agrisoli]|uniref:RNA polymerase sigma factor n=1 Tax=Chitinophaga agrisoli TaxID=2607653 RepID=A0A5B2VXJ0_9BACT|nr:RNA polymerase sigma factor [Chitinophaga agrisoli]KAA2244553.1 RNA polymerase sigma factor [Chitinophaga agrisoli]
MQEKEAQGLTALYRDTFPQVARVVQQLGGDLETAKDLFHDALIIYLEKQQQLNVRTSVPAYLIGITKILWFRKFRNDSRQRPLDDVADDISIPEDFYTPPPEKNRTLLQHLQVAGKKCMQLLQAFYYRQLSMQEVAETFGYKSTHSATVQKYKCLEKVREQIKQANYEAATT